MRVVTKIQTMIEVEADRPFSEKETLENIRKIGTREALGKLSTVIGETKYKMRIVSKPLIQSFEFREQK